MDLERNKTCHCGSGKNYENCCSGLNSTLKNFLSLLSNEPMGDSLSSLKCFDTFELEEEDEEEDDLDIEDVSDLEQEDSDLEKEEPDLETQKKRYACESFKEKLPPVSKEEERMVSKWKSRFEKLLKPSQVDAQKCIEMIQSFLKQHPHLASHLDLHERGIDRIERACLEQYNYSDFICFLKWFRKHAFNAYCFSGAFYDLTIIIYHIVEGTTKEIPKYFDFFKKYPVDSVDYLGTLMRVFKASNQVELLYDLLKDIYPHIYYSDRIFFGEHFVIPILKHHYFKCAKRNYTSKDLDRLVLSMQSIAQKVPHMGIYTQKKYWERVLDRICHTPCPKRFPSTKKEIKKFYEQVSNSFRAYLHRRRKLKWMSADYYSGLIFSYLMIPLNKNKRPKIPFIFEEALICFCMNKQCGGYLYTSEVFVFSYFRALFYFVDFLVNENLLSESEIDHAIDILQSLSLDYYIKLHEGSYVVKFFKKKIPILAKF